MKKLEFTIILPAVILSLLACTLPTDPRGNCPPLITSFGRGVDTVMTGVDNTISTASFDNASDAVSYRYRIVSGGGTLSGSGSNILYRPATPGQKVIEVTATDSGGALSRRTVALDAYDIERWVPVTANAGFSPREGHRAVVFNDRIWVIGGE